VALRVDLDSIRSKLAHRVPQPANLSEIERKAAVAAILRPRDQDTDVLLIRRAERANDPWSGHMALPGGHQEPVDIDSRATAMRETLEEVGIDLGEHEYLGQLDEVGATVRGRFVGLTIAPHVFALRGQTILHPNYEVAEVVWAELGKMARGEVDATKQLDYEGELRQFPAFRVHGHVVWGLTHMMLRSFFAVLAS
jgi:8-oxo-dGTP pyrophosphatase MutT (NUDIX family)